ncbi:MAG: SAM-dependent methyltransferase [Flavipsychrobacter sp.]|nr:SAM-dependent methyltransferase [Flavipsychrobacter sp.]
MSNKAKLYLIPVPIADGAVHTLPADVYTITDDIKYYFVENIRSARRFLRLLHPAINIDEMQFSEISKHEGADMNTFKKWLKEGHTIGVLSESGCPGIADPGAELAAVAHQAGVAIIPITGPSSIILSLMASGLNGQSFCFTGYLPVKDPERSKRIKQLEQVSAKEKQTQLFIETPYRNDALLADLLKTCLPGTRLCIAQNLTAPDAFIKTCSIEQWKKETRVLGKIPAVFLILA